MFFNSMNKEKFMELLASVPVPIAIFDSDMRFIFCTQRWYESFEVKKEFLIGKTLFEVNKVMQPHWRTACDEALSGKVISRDIDFFPRVNGREDWIRWVMQPWYDGDQKIGGVVLFAEIITDRISLKEQQEKYQAKLEATVFERTADLEYSKQLSEAYAQDLEHKAVELLQAKQDAEKASKVKSSFLANMSHELRTPLSSIIGLSNVLSRTELSSEQVNFLSIILQSANNMLALVNDILDLAKIEADGLVLDIKPFHFLEQIADSISPLQALALEKKLLLQTHFDVSDEYVLGDPLRIRQIITNLVGNAIKYTDHGKIEINVKGLDKNDYFEFVISIRDTGIGISKEILPKIFDKFIQADDSGTKKYGGTGLGLSITKELVLSMNGSVHVESILGSGTTFTVHLPLHKCKEYKIQEISTSLLKQQSNNDKIPAYQARILVAEDHIFNQVLMDRLLFQMGITNFTIVADGLEAFSHWKSGAYDIIIMDCSMPILSGFDVTRQIRSEELASGKHIPIIALTANAMAGDRQACLDCGMDDYLSKPFNEAELLEILSRWIDFNPHVFSSFTPINSNKLEDNQHHIINLSFIKDYADNNIETEKDLISIFMNQSLEIIKEMEGASQDVTSDDWQELAHKLKGGARSVGANKLSDMCQNIQQCHSKDITARMKIQNEVSNHYMEIQSQLESYLKTI